MVRSAGALPDARRPEDVSRVPRGEVPAAGGALSRVVSPPCGRAGKLSQGDGRPRREDSREIWAEQPADEAVAWTCRVALAADAADARSRREPMPNVTARTRSTRSRRRAASQPRLVLVPMPAVVPATAEPKRVRGVKLKTVSTFTLVFALLCVAAFCAGRPPAAAMGAGSASKPAASASHVAKGAAHVSGSANRRVPGKGTRQGQGVVRQSAGLAAIL